ncbi:MAG: histidine phosphatase family protein [Jatrophihabitantaceae bacterium]
MAGIIEIVFETHSWSTDNNRGIATGWHPGDLSDPGRELAAELGQRHRRAARATSWPGCCADRIDAVFTSDLRRAAQTAEVAFTGSTGTILLLTTS